MLRTSIEMKTITGKGWGKTAQVLLPGGPTYYGFYLDTRVTDSSNNTTFLNPEDFRVIIKDNGHTRLEMSGEDIVMLCDFEKKYRVDGVYHIDLTPQRSKTIDGALIAGMETNPVGNYVFQVVVNSKDGSGNTPDFDLAGWASVSENLQGRVGEALAYYLPRIRKTVIDLGKVGKNSVTDLFDGADVSLLGLHILDEGRVDRLTVLQGNGSTKMVPVWERTRWLNELMLREEERAPQADYFHFDPIETGYVMLEKLELSGLQTALEIEALSSGKVEALVYTLERVEVRPAGETAA